jgi:hypothetical protein
MSELKHVAILRSGGRVDITLPLKPSGLPYLPETQGWRVDQNGVLINLEHVAAIVGAEPERMGSRKNACEHCGSFRIDGEPPVLHTADCPKRRGADLALDGCPRDVWDGPYRMQCGRAAASRDCPRHGRF